jgi:putative copper export protein
MRPAVLVHAAAVAFRIGALVPLAAAMRTGTAVEAVLGRLSRAIPWAVAALIVSGAVRAAAQVAESRALLTTAPPRRH